MLKLTAAAAFITGVVSIVGGLQGYFGPAKSTPSLIAGGAVGCFLLFGGRLCLSGKEWAPIIVLLAGMALAGRFLPAFLKDTGNLWPALVMAALGGATAVIAILSLFAKRS